ncbi:hypothetical protein HanRHA438_Chr14g0675091 [Helianthus annuus]|nr:hypothetical protein HanRHA438_Chr14g0675091 [Helianthus annuus]
MVWLLDNILNFENPARETRNPRKQPEEHPYFTCFEFVFFIFNNLSPLSFLGKTTLQPSSSIFGAATGARGGSLRVISDMFEDGSSSSAISIDSSPELDAESDSELSSPPFTT